MIEGTFTCIHCKVEVTPLSLLAHDFGTLCPWSWGQKRAAFIREAKRKGRVLYEDSDSIFTTEEITCKPSGSSR